MCLLVDDIGSSLRRIWKMERTREEKIVRIFESVKAHAKGISGRFVDMDDLVQFTMEKILKAKNLPQYPSDKWIFACTWNARNDVLRKIYKERECRDFFTSIDSTRLSYEEDCDTIVPAIVSEPSEPYLACVIESAISQLTLAHREAFVFYAAGLSYAQISQLTKTNINTVRSRLFFAKSSLRCLLANCR